MDKNVIKIANCSGFYGDKLSAAKDMVDGGPIDVLTGDYLAELTMTILYSQKLQRGDDKGYVGTFLKQVKEIAQDCKNKNIKIALSDPMGSALYSHIKNNKLESKGSSITEGIGTGRITQNFDKALVDDAFQTDDTEALNIVYDLIERQKIVLGGSSGINIAGAIKLAKKMGPGNTIVTILCDHGKRYASKIFNKDFLKSKNLPIPKWL